MKDIGEISQSRSLVLLREAYAARQSVDESYTLRRFASDLGYKNPSMVSAIFNGKRRLKVDVAARMASVLDFDDEATQELKLLVMLENSTSRAEKDCFEKLIGKKKHPSSFLGVSQDKFRLIADWYHLAIYAGLKLSTPVFGASDFAGKIKVPLNPVLIDSALKRLERLGFVRKAKDGSYRTKNRELYVESVDRGDDAIKKHHQGTLRIATDMINQPTDKRDLRSTCLAVKRKDLQEIRKLAKEFHERVHEFSCDFDGEEVVIINTQICSVIDDQQAHSTHSRDVSSQSSLGSQPTHP